MIEDLLLQVRKPARYIGQEWNVSRKNFGDAAIKFALVFPDLYEVGMSNLGTRIVYSVLNSSPDVACERFFSVDDDMEEKLRSAGESIFSLESRKPLRDFDIVGFSLDSELDYTNVLRILDLGSVPLKATQRNHTHPLVIGGGGCTLNPEPMHEFFDLFIIGEAEDIIQEFIEAYRRHKTKFKAGAVSKEELLFVFSQLEGVYVPSFYEVAYSAAGDGKITGFSPKIKGVPKKIKKRFVRDLDKSHFPLDWLLPYIQIIHDRVTLEVMRGCPNRCRFCQARSQYFPFRIRNAESILHLAGCSYKRTGYEEISLIGLSVTDYPGIDKLLESLNALFSGRGISISLPSIKAKAGTGKLSSIIARVKKTGLTFAPEAGSERLRQMLAKDFNEEDFFKALEEAYLSGYQHVKLYFMIGLPYESQEDLDEIINFSVRVSELRRKAKSSPAQVNISINALIPKPHTAFQWFGMETAEGLKAKQDHLRKAAKNKRLRLAFHYRAMSFLEGVLSRGDRRLSDVIFLAFAKGAKFDAWGDHFRAEKWMEAFEEKQIDPAFYLKEKSVHDILPWDFIDTGIDKETLVADYNKILQ